MTKKSSSASTNTASSSTVASAKGSSFVLLNDSALDTLGLNKVNKTEQFTTVFKMVDETSDKNDRDTLFVYLFTLVSEEKNEAKQTQNYESVISKIQSLKDFTLQDVFKQLVSAFNIITNGNLKAKLFIHIIQQMQQHEDLSTSLNILPIAENIDSALNEWGISAKKDKQTIYLELANLCIKLSKINEAFDLLIKNLKSNNEANEKQQLINLYIKYPLEKSAEELKEFEPELFDGVLTYLESESEQVPEVLNQKLSQYEKNESVIASFLSELKILRFLVACSTKLLTTKKDIELKYSDIEKLAPNAEVEPFICELMGRNLIECKMNQLDQSVYVQSVKCRGAVHKCDWKNLESLVNVWTSKLSSVLTSLNSPVNPHQFKSEATRQQ
ncbi:hypothetical protein C9374_006930 [Naegleria lovaniensis]|uniref:Eukaryotic translation initiation factor 3 subunit M n=1 Tax=Naegleria lovaniensis TaxID=51637 RepID=A0AA88KS86_NAELO|nr:uncharacterized protein C9374_006930 [Naegleria lovaniensis]KAG2393399.1 hypothetical protein C9374_006930 [Naegleria lovaniensis]